jgi:homospermidine synthase
MKTEEAKERITEIYYDILNAGQGLISSHLAKKYTLIVVNRIEEDREKLFNRFGIGFMDKAVARNNFKNHSLYSECKQLKKLLKDI